MNTNHIDVKNLCSSKLWEILKQKPRSTVSHLVRQRAEQELLVRRHYVEEISSLREQPKSDFQPH